MSKLQTEAATRWAGAAAALVAASALMATLLPAPEAPAEVVLALHAVLQLGCAAVLLSTAPDLARRAWDTGVRVGGASSACAWLLRWLGFACVAVVVCALDLSVGGNVAAAEAEAEAEAALDAVRGFLLLLFLFLVLLAGIWAVYLSFVVRGRGGGAPPAAAAAAAAAGEEEEEEDP